MVKKAVLREILAAEEQGGLQVVLATEELDTITNKETQLLTEKEFLTAVLEKPPAEKPSKQRKKKVQK